MKKIKGFILLLAALGIVLALGTVALSLGNLNTPPVLLSASQEAADAAQFLMDALAEGDFSQAETVLYGTPSLGADRKSADAVGQLIWDTFVQSIDYQFEGQLYATDVGLAQNVSITTLEITSVTRHLKERSEALLEERVAAAEDVSQIYDENNDYREEFVMQVLYDAASESLREDAQYVTQDVTLNLVFHQQRWWVMADQALLRVISGGTAG